TDSADYNGPTESRALPLQDYEAETNAEQSSATEIQGDNSAEQSSAGQPRAAIPTRPEVERNFDPSQFFSQFLTQLYIGQPYVPRNIFLPVDFEDRESLEEVLSEQMSDKNVRPTRVHILVPSRGDKRSLLDLAANNAKQLYDQR